MKTESPSAKRLLPGEVQHAAYQGACLRRRGNPRASSCSKTLSHDNNPGSRETYKGGITLYIPNEASIIKESTYGYHLIPIQNEMLPRREA